MSVRVKTRTVRRGEAAAATEASVPHRLLDHGPLYTSVSDRHDAAVRRSLGWAQESADRGDYRNALAWIRTLEAIGEELAPAYQAKRQAWGSLLAPGQTNRGQVAGTGG
jgi:hypothetical protein